MHPKHAKIERGFNVSIIRIYTPGCRESSVWTKLLQAVIKHDIFIVPDVEVVLRATKLAFRRGGYRLSAHARNNVVDGG